MTTVTLEVPSVQEKEYEKIFTQFIRNYSIEELKDMQERNILYKKLSFIEKEEETKKMNLDESNNYLDNLF